MFFSEYPFPRVHRRRHCWHDCNPSKTTAIGTERQELRKTAARDRWRCLGVVLNKLFVRAVDAKNAKHCAEIHFFLSISLYFRFQKYLTTFFVTRHYRQCTRNISKWPFFWSHREESATVRNVIIKSQYALGMYDVTY